MRLMLAECAFWAAALLVVAWLTGTLVLPFVFRASTWPALTAAYALAVVFAVTVLVALTYDTWKIARRHPSLEHLVYNAVLAARCLFLMFFAWTLVSLASALYRTGVWSTARRASSLSGSAARCLWISTCRTTAALCRATVSSGLFA